MEKLELVKSDGGARCSSFDDMSDIGRYSLSTRPMSEEGLCLCTNMACSTELTIFAVAAKKPNERLGLDVTFSARPFARLFAFHLGVVRSVRRTLMQLSGGTKKIKFCSAHPGMTVSDLPLEWLVRAAKGKKKLVVSSADRRPTDIAVLSGCHSPQENGSGRSRRKACILFCPCLR